MLFHCIRNDENAVGNIVLFVIFQICLKWRYSSTIASSASKKPQSNKRVEGNLFDSSTNVTHNAIFFYCRNSIKVRICTIIYGFYFHFWFSIRRFRCINASALKVLKKVILFLCSTTNKEIHKKALNLKVEKLWSFWKQ